MYQLEAVRHGHPIVNGYSGWKSQLQEWLGGGASPLRDPGQLPDAIRGLRAIGVRYVLLHDRTFTTPQEAASLADAIRRLKDQIVEEHRFGGTWAWRLADGGANADVRRARLEPDRLGRIDPSRLTIDVSQQHMRAEYLIDGDLESRWLSGGPQNGDEWIEVRLPRATDVARVELTGSARTLYDYPMRLRIESDGRALFDGRIVEQLVEALAVDEAHPRLTIDLPPNSTTRLRISQTGQSNHWWSVHELAIYDRTRN
jgi:hypothetical protein